MIRAWSPSNPLVISLTLWERDYVNMIEDETENRIVAANAGSSQAVAMIEGSETRVETASSFGPWRAAHRSYRASSLDSLGSVRSLHRSRDECRHIADQLRRVCDYYQEKEIWWRNNVSSIRMQHSEREHERNRILEASEVEWATRYSQLQGAAAAVSQQMTEQHLFAESQAERLQAIERSANEEINEFRGNAEKASLNSTR